MILLDVEGDCLVGSSQGLPFFTFFQNGSDVFLFPVCLTAKDFLDMIENCLAIFNISLLLQNPGMHLTGSYGLMYV